MIIDLHSHTTASDGRLTPHELLLRAENRQVDVLAITDHDNMDGVIAAQKIVREQNLSIQIVNGVEISSKWHNFEIHVLGLNVNPTDTFLAQLRSQQNERQLRGERIAAQLEKIGFTQPLDGAAQFADGAPLSRAHFARWLVSIGAVSHMQKAFDKYLGRGQRAYVKPDWVTMADAIKWIQAAGGHAVLAHPTKYDLSNKWVRKLIADFSGAGGDGMEVAQSQQAPDQRRFLADLSIEYNLMASQGSDFHGSTPWLDLGKNLSLPEQCTPIWHAWPSFSCERSNTV